MLGVALLLHITFDYKPNNESEHLIWLKGIVTVTPTTNSSIAGFPYQATFDIKDANLYKFNGELLSGSPQYVYFANVISTIGTSSNGVNSICMPYFNYGSDSYENDITKFNSRFAPKTWKILSGSNVSVTVVFVLLVWI